MTSAIRPGARPEPQPGAAAERLMTVEDLSEMLGVPVVRVESVAEQRLHLCLSYDTGDTDARGT